MPRGVGRGAAVVQGENEQGHGRAREEYGVFRGERVRSRHADATGLGYFTIENSPFASR
jgi:hypothetical protein